MERLLKDADALSESFNLQADETGNLVYGYAEIVDAIHIVQENMGIAGTTAKEAGTTIEGSVSSMKSAWANLLTGVADDNQDMVELVDNLVISLVGDGSNSNKGVFGNIIPRVETIMGGVVTLISEIAPVAIKEIPKLVTKILPELVAAASSLLQGVAVALPELIQSIVAVLPQLIQSIGQGITTSLPVLLSSLTETISFIADTLSDPDTLQTILDTGLDIIMSLADGLVENIPEILTSVLKLISGIARYIMNKDNLKKIVSSALSIVKKLAEGLFENLPKLIEQLPEFVEGIVKALLDVVKLVFETDWINIGINILDGIVKGLQKGFQSAVDAIIGLGDKIVELFCDVFGIESPSKVFRDKVGKNLVLGLAKGIKDNTDSVSDAVSEIEDITTGALVSGMSITGASDARVYHTGTIRIEGVNNKGEFVDASEYVLEDMMVNLMRRQARLV